MEQQERYKEDRQRLLHCFPSSTDILRSRRWSIKDLIGGSAITLMKKNRNNFHGIVIFSQCLLKNALLQKLVVYQVSAPFIYQFIVFVVLCEIIYFQHECLYFTQKLCIF